MKFEVIKGVPVALGVEWFALPDNKAERSRLKKGLQKSLKPTHELEIAGETAPYSSFVSTEDEGESADSQKKTYYGVVSTRAQRKRPKRFASAAGWLSTLRTPDHGLTAFVWVLPDQHKAKDISHSQAWVCALDGSAPMARGDRVVKLTAVADTLVEIFGDRRSEVAVYVAGFTPNQFPVLGHGIGDFKSVDATTLEGMFHEDCPSKVMMPQYGLSNIAIAISFSIIFLVFGSLGVGGWLYYQHLQEQIRKAEELRRQAELAALPPPQEIYTLEFAKGFAMGRAKLLASDAAKAVYATFKQTEMVSSGWLFDSLTCTVDPLPGAMPSTGPNQQPMCQINYKRTPAAGKLPLSKAEFVEIGESLDGAYGRRPFVAKNVDLPQHSARLSAFMSPALRNNLLNHLRFIDDMFKIKEANGVQNAVEGRVTFTPAGPLPPFPGQPVLSVGASPFEIKVGDWSMIGSMAYYENLYLLESVAYIKSITISADKAGLIFNAQGSYYVAEARPAPLASAQTAGAGQAQGTSVIAGNPAVANGPANSGAAQQVAPPANAPVPAQPTQQSAMQPDAGAAASISR